jgi:hypothetical protein
MDWLTFTSKIIESLAWPVAAVALVALLRNEIGKLAPFLKKVKAGPVEAEFEREVKELKASTPDQREITETKQHDPASKSFLFQLASLHPRSAVLETWVRVEASARAVLAAKPVAAGSMATYLPAARLAEPLAQQGILSEPQVTLFHELRRLRNEVAHSQGFEPTYESACAYIDLGIFLQGFLEGKLQ